MTELLIGIGIKVSYNAPPISRPCALPRRYGFGMICTPLDALSLGRADCVLIATDHDAYDSPFILKHARLIVVGTRNAFSDSEAYRGRVH